MTHDHAPADWAAGGLGFVFSVWQWATEGMSPLSVLVAVSSLILIALRVYESHQRRKLMREFGTVNKSALRKIFDAVQTKPDDLKD